MTNKTGAKTLKTRFMMLTLLAVQNRNQQTSHQWNVWLTIRATAPFYTKPHGQVHLFSSDFTAWILSSHRIGLAKPRFHRFHP